MGQSESYDIFVSELKVKELMVMGSSISFTVSIPMGK